jgi:hypothetical protein
MGSGHSATAPLLFFASRVPDTFQLDSISAFLEFRASSRINNLRVFNARNIPTLPPRRRHNNARIINRLRPLFRSPEPEIRSNRPSTEGGGMLLP